MTELQLRVAGFMAPAGSPEREYWETSFAPDSPLFRAAEQRLIAEGCPPLTVGQKPSWSDAGWVIT